MAKIDLDGPRAARREALKEPPKLVLEGKEYDLTPELPDVLMEEMAALPSVPEGEEPSDADAEAIMAGMRRLAAAVLGPHWEELRPRLSSADISEIVSQLAPVYGFESVGESSASAAS